MFLSGQPVKSINQFTPVVKLYKLSYVAETFGMYPYLSSLRRWWWGCVRIVSSVKFQVSSLFLFVKSHEITEGLTKNSREAIDACLFGGL